MNDITDDVIRDMAETVIRSAASDIDYMGIGEQMSDDERFIGLSQDEFDEVQTRISDELGNATITISWDGAE